MKKSIKKRWVQALRSGKYQQGYTALRRESGFCCLGVLCDLHAKETGTHWIEEGKGKFSYLGESGVLPQEVVRWAGMDCDNPYAGLNAAFALSEHNDRGQSFKYIATRIEKGL